MGGKDVARGGGAPGDGERRPLALHGNADALQPQEGRVPLVHVADGGLDLEGGQRAHAADAEHDLLADAHVQVTAVQAAADNAVLGAVDGQVRVEQVQGHAPYLHAPDMSDHRPAGILHLDGDRLAVAAALHLHRHGVKVVHRVGLLLPAVGVEVLPEVAFLVEEADADQGQAEVAGGL